MKKEERTRRRTDGSALYVRARTVRVCVRPQDNFSGACARLWQTSHQFASNNDALFPLFFFQTIEERVFHLATVLFKWSFHQLFDLLFASLRRRRRLVTYKSWRRILNSSSSSPLIFSPPTWLHWAVLWVEQDKAKGGPHIELKGSWKK